MRLSQIEPAAPGYDVHTFECAKCNSSERFGSYLSAASMLAWNKPVLWKFRLYLDSECSVPLRVGRWLVRTTAVGKRANASPFRLGPSRNDPGV